MVVLIYSKQQKKRDMLLHACPECEGKNNMQDINKDKKRTIVSIPDLFLTLTLHKTTQYNYLDCGAKLS